MKTYITKIKSQPFIAAFDLQKRLILPYTIAGLIILIISFAILIPSILAFLGLNFGHLIDLQNSVLSQNISSGKIPQALPLSNPQTNFPFFLFLMVFFLIFYAWIANFLFNINNNEVRNNNNSVIQGLKQSFNSRVFTIMGYLVLFGLFQLCVMMLFGFLSGLLMVSLESIGTLIAFITGIFICVLMFRLSLTLPAIIHGKMSVFEAFNYSYKNLTWKRATLLFLMTLAFLLIVFVLAFSLIALFAGISVSIEGTQSVSIFFLMQLTLLVVNILLISFVFASMSVLFFRYNSEAIEDNNEAEHLVVS